MTEDKNDDLAGKAADVASKAKAKAEELAAAAAPAVEQLKGKATEFAAAAAPKANAAATAASHQVGPLAGRLKKLTGGRFDKQIETVSHKLEETLDRSDKPGGYPPPPPAPPTATPPTTTPPTTTPPPTTASPTPETPS